MAAGAAKGRCPGSMLAFRVAAIPTTLMTQAPPREISSGESSAHPGQDLAEDVTVNVAHNVKIHRMNKLSNLRISKIAWNRFLGETISSQSSHNPLFFYFRLSVEKTNSSQSSSFAHSTFLSHLQQIVQSPLASLFRKVSQPKKLRAATRIFHHFFGCTLS